MDWGKRHDIDKLIENLFKILKSDEEVNDHLETLRSRALRLIGLEPLIRIETVNPIYPIFEIPCQLCLRVNEAPGVCPCGNVLTGISQDIENSVWKMMKEIGRDLWCESCKSNRADYLRPHCKCGGRWVSQEDPLNWVEYVDKQGKEWEFV